MSNKYKKSSAKDFVKIANILRNGKTPKNFSYPEFCEYLFSTPYDRLKEQMTNSQNKGEDVLKSLLLALPVSLKNQNKKDLAYYEDIFEEFYARVPKSTRFIKILNTEDMYRVLRKHQISAECSKERSDFYAKYKDDNTKADWKMHVDGVNECSQMLKDCDRMLRGSSDAYKEIQSELSMLSDFMNESVNGSIDCMYAGIMMKALAEKADQYVADRELTELKHSKGGYKGKRIAAMRKVSTLLKMKAERIDKFNKGKGLSEEGEEYLKNLLSEKLSSMTYSNQLYFELAHLNGEYSMSVNNYLNTQTKTMGTMTKAFHKAIIPYEHCKEAIKSAEKEREKCATELNDKYYKNKNGADFYAKECTEGLKKLNKFYEVYRLDGRNFHMLSDSAVFENKPDYITDNKYTTIANIVSRQQAYIQQMKELDIPTKKSVYPEDLKKAAEDRIAEQKRLNAPTKKNVQEDFILGN